MNIHGPRLTTMLFTLAAVVLLAASPIAFAQDRPSQSESEEQESPGRLPLAGPVTYVGPDTYILLDATGRPQKFLGMKYEDFVAALERAEAQPAESDRPRYAIETLVVEGKAEAGFANLRAKIEIRILSDDPVRVPLGFSGAILKSWTAHRSSPSESSETNAYLDYGAASGGFRVGLRGSPSEVYNVTLELLVPLENDANNASLQFACPQAATSRLTLDVPAEGSTASVNVGALVSSEPGPEEGTRFVVLGAHGNVRLTWTISTWRQAMALDTVLSASGSIRISLDGRSVRSDARLLVQSFGGSFDRFRVRLPPGAELIGPVGADAASQATEYTISDDEAAPSPVPDRDDSDEGRIVLVQLRQKRTAPIEIHLLTEQPLGLGNRSSPTQLAGFEVVGAVRQFGDVGITMDEAVVNDWRVEWFVGANVRQVEPSNLPEEMRSDDLLAAFQYDRQPWSLRGQVSPRETEIDATPRYEMTIGPEEARLTAEITYRIPGARTFAFDVDLKGWELTSDPIEPLGLVDRESVVVNEEGILRLPLLQASSRRAVITFHLKRNLPAEVGAFELPLPAPKANSIARAELVVRVAPSLELQPDPSKQVGLSPLPVTSEANDSEFGLAVFRYRAIGSEAKFAASKALRAQQLSVAMNTRSKALEDALEIDQEFAYDVRYQPLHQLEFEIPSQWPTEETPVGVSLIASEANQSNMEVVAGEAAEGSGEESAAISLPYQIESVAGEGQSTGRRITVALPHPRLGRFVVRADYRLPQPAKDAFSPNRGTTYRVPFLLPQGGDLTEHRLAFEALADSQVELVLPSQASEWQVVSRSGPAGETPATIHVATLERVDSLEVEVQPASDALWHSAVVERVWLQTWLAGRIRQDRAVYRFRPQGRWVVVELPPAVAVDELEVLVDQKPAEVELQEAGRLHVQVPDSGAVSSHTLELRYRMEYQPSAISRLRWTPPQLVGNRALCEVYWQLVLPSELHVVRSPEQLAMAGDWAWLGDYWGHKPPLTQGDLEGRLNATTQLPPAPNEHQYLFTGLIPPASINLLLAPRWLIVLLVSGATLIGGLGLAYYLRFRARLLVLVLVGACAFLLVVFPSPTVLIGQAAILGLVMVFVSVGLYRMFSTTSWRGSWPAMGSTAVLIRPASDVHTTPPAAGSLSGRKTAVPIRISDSKT